MTDDVVQLANPNDAQQLTAAITIAAQDPRISQRQR